VSFLLDFRLVVFRSFSDFPHKFANQFLTSSLTRLIKNHTTSLSHLSDPLSLGPRPSQSSGTDRSADTLCLSFASVGLQIMVDSVIICFYLKYSEVLNMYFDLLE
jgi:hypothetical protein